MTHYVAIVTERNSIMQGRSIANTKSGKYKNMSKEEFETEVKKNTCFTFKVEELKPIPEHREYLKDHW
jgi:hypothetical protein